MLRIVQEDKMRKKIAFSVIIVFFISLLIISGCSRKEDSHVIEIGAIIPLSGESAALGMLHKNGIDLATKEINESGGILGKNLEIVYEDSKNDGKTGLSAFRKLLNINKVPAIICTFSKVCVPVSSVMKSENISNTVLFDTATSAPNITLGNEYIFRSFITSAVEAKEIYKYIVDTLNLSRIAVYYVNDDYGLGSAEAFVKETEQKGKGEIVFKDFFEITQTEHRSTVLKIKTSKPEAIFITGYGQSFVALIKQIREAQVDSEIFCTATLALPDVFGNLGEEKNGLYLTSSLYDESSKIPDYINFKNDYNEMFPDSQDNYQSAATYMVLKLIAKAIEKRGETPQEIKNGLQDIQDFPSPLGNITLDENREAPFPVKIKKVINGSIENIEK